MVARLSLSKCFNDISIPLFLFWPSAPCHRHNHFFQSVKSSCYCFIGKPMPSHQARIFAKLRFWDGLLSTSPSEPLSNSSAESLLFAQGSGCENTPTLETLEARARCDYLIKCRWPVSPVLVGTCAVLAGIISKVANGGWYFVRSRPSRLVRGMPYSDARLAPAWRATEQILKTRAV